MVFVDVSGAGLSIPGGGATQSFTGKDASSTDEKNISLILLFPLKYDHHSFRTLGHGA